jgi:hypothetical protein
MKKIPLISGIFKSLLYKNNTAIVVVTINPSRTGKKFFLAKSRADTPQKPATATSEDQAINVPPPVQIAPICPIAASVAGSSPAPFASAPDSAPVSGSPEKPEPSSPVIIPIINIPKAVKNELCGICSCAEATKSNRNAGVTSLSPNERILGAKSLLPKKKNPAIGITGQRH